MMPFKDILLEAMQPGVANTIFAKFGVKNAAHLDKGNLRKYYMSLVKKHHPDKGGSDEDMRWINAAYDVLSTQAPDVPSIELKREDKIIYLEFKDYELNTLDSGQCNHIEFLEILEKIKNEGIDIRTDPPSNYYDKINDVWKVPQITIFIDQNDFFVISPYIEPFFKH